MRMQIGIEVLFSMLLALSIAYLLSAIISSPGMGLANASRAMAGSSNVINNEMEGLLNACGSCRAWIR